MARGVGHMQFDPRNFFLKSCNPLLELVDREGSKVLLEKQGERVLRLAGKEVILIHAWNR